MLPIFSSPLGHYLGAKFRFVLTVAGHVYRVFTCHLALFANAHANSNDNSNRRSLCVYEIIKQKINNASCKIFYCNRLPTIMYHVFHVENIVLILNFNYLGRGDRINMGGRLSRWRSWGSWKHVAQNYVLWLHAKIMCLQCWTNAING